MKVAATLAIPISLSFQVWAADALRGFYYIRPVTSENEVMTQIGDKLTVKPKLLSDAS